MRLITWVCCNEDVSTGLDDRHYSSDGMECDEEEVLLDVEDDAPIDEKIERGSKWIFVFWCYERL